MNRSRAALLMRLLLASIAVSAASLWEITLQQRVDAAEIEKSRSVVYPRKAPHLVNEALTADLKGDQRGRTVLLKRATQADGDFAPARWQAVEVMFDGQWRSPEEVAKHVAADDRWKMYEVLRRQASEATSDQLHLAQWCMQRGLTFEEHYHWGNVLMSDPGHEQARQRLGLQEYQGRLQTREQAAAAKEQREQAERDLARYKPKLAILCREVCSNLKVNREKAIAKIRGIDDPAAIPALREAVRKTIDSSAGKRHRSELILAMTAALAGMPQHDATLNLVELAVYSSLPEVRQAAAEALRPRPTTDYVPQLMALLQAPLEVDYSIVAAPDGMVRMIETVYERTPMFEAARTRTTNFEVVGALGRDQAKTDVGAVLNRHLNAATSRVNSTQAEIDSANAAAKERNQRVQAVLKGAIGMEAPEDDVTAWWSSWQTHNELEFEVPKTIQESEYDETYVFAYEQAPPPTVALNIPEPPPMTSCFAPGTLVWKPSGPTPIEHIRVGDLVLSQQPTTGELTYRPVLDKTVGKLTPVLHIRLSGDEITSTLGHRFWVDGIGWQMAKELTPTHSLHSVRGGMKVDSVESAGEMECHNLEVDDFHTFVVGKSKVLVHDKTCPLPTLAATPGLDRSKLVKNVSRSVGNVPR